MLTAEVRLSEVWEWGRVGWKAGGDRFGVVSGGMLLIMYASMLIYEVVEPYDLDARNTDFIYAPPQRIRIFDKGQLVAPFIYGYDYRLDMNTPERVYTSNGKRETIRFFCHTSEDRFLGVSPVCLQPCCPSGVC